MTFRSRIDPLRGCSSTLTLTLAVGFCPPMTLTSRTGARIRLPRTSTSTEPSWIDVTTPSRPKPPTTTRSPTTGAAWVSSRGASDCGATGSTTRRAMASTAARASLRALPVSPVLITSRGESWARRSVLTFSSSMTLSISPPRLPDFSFELIRQPFPVGFLTLLERFFALAHARFCGRERLAFTCHESLFVFDHTHGLDRSLPGARRVGRRARSRSCGRRQ